MGTFLHVFSKMSSNNTFIRGHFWTYVPEVYLWLRNCWKRPLLGFPGSRRGFSGSWKTMFSGFSCIPPSGTPPGPLQDQNRCKTAPIPKTKKKFLYTFCTLWALFCTFSAKCRRIIHLLEATFFTPGAVLASSKQVGFFRPRILKQRRNLHFGVEKLHLFELAVFIKIMVKSGFGV